MNIYLDYINENHEPDNKLNQDLEDMQLLAKDINQRHSQDMTLEQRVELFENLAEDFRDDQFDEDDEFHFNNILMIAEKELFPETPLCQMCDCTDLMCVCAIKCPIYRRFHR